MSIELQVGVKVFLRNPEGKYLLLRRAVDPKAQGRINSLYMTATFLGGAIGAMVSGWLMTRFGWNGIVVFGVVLGLVASAIHWIGAPRRTGGRASPDADAAI